jgi:phage tail sheath protein FI
MNYQVGVNMLEGTALAPVDGVTTGVAGIVGTFERGPLNQATLVTSMQQFQSTFGNVPLINTTTWYSVKAFFQRVGSGQLYIVRVAGTTPVKGTVTFQDQHGTPVNTLKVDAINEGAWGNDLSVDIDDHSILSTTLTVDVPTLTAVTAFLTSTEGIEVGSYVHFYNGTNDEYVVVTIVDHSAKQITWVGALTNAYTTVNGVITTQEFSLKVYEKGTLVETWDGLSMNDDVTFFVERAITSSYVTVTDLDTTSTGYLGNPAATSGATIMASGDDDMANIVAADYIGVQGSKTGIFAFDNVSTLFRFAVPAPTLTDAAVPEALLSVNQAALDYADARVTVQFYTEAAYNTTVADTVTWAGNFAGRRMAVFFPWVKVIESGLTKWLPPSTFALGNAVKKDYERGVHKSVGNTAIAYGIDLEYHVSRPEGETLNDAKVNTLRSIPGGGLRVYGGRCLASTTAFRFLDASEYWNYIARSLEIATQWVPFELNDDILWKGVKRVVGNFLANEQSKRALFDASNPGGIPYTVVMDTTNNPADQVALGYAKLDIAYVKTGTAEKFVITLTPSPSGLAAS